MMVDWEEFPHRHAKLLPLVVVLKKLRTKIGFAVFALCVARGLYLRERPIDPDDLDRFALTGLLCITAGIALRIAAHGCLHKKEQLSTTGVYSLCRHPLYLGSMLWTLGFCILLKERANFVVAGVYFAIFYTVTIIWEEVRVRQRYGKAHAEYARQVPLLLPIGHFKHGLFGWREAMRSGGALLLVQTVIMVGAIDAVAELAPPGWS